MYTFEIQFTDGQEIVELMSLVDGVGSDEAHYAIKKHWDGSGDVLQLFLASLGGGGIATILNFLLGWYKEGKVEIKSNGRVIKCHKSSLKDVKEFIQDIETASGEN